MSDELKEATLVTEDEKKWLKELEGGGATATSALGKRKPVPTARAAAAAASSKRGRA